jgi:hypothetical protein
MIGNTLDDHGLPSIPEMEHVVPVVVVGPRDISTDPSNPVTMIVDRLECGVFVVRETSS